jgi:hypothetical protein
MHIYVASGIVAKNEVPFGRVVLPDFDEPALRQHVSQQQDIFGRDRYV